jgi:imidazolonepropionase-like amidohydrolase
MNRIVFRNANLLDGDNPARPNTSVAIEGERICEVGDAAAVPGRPDDREVDLAGRTLMPGMFSCHFHVAFSDWAPAAAPTLGLEAQPGFIALVAQKNITTAFDCGFTSLVCSSSVYNLDHALKVAISRGLIEGPRIWACTHELMTPGDQADGLNMNWYMEIGNTGMIRHCSGPESFREAVRQELGRGADVAKVSASIGHGTGPASEEMESISRAELIAATEAAHGRGKLIRAHAASLRSIRDCIHAGVDIIDHADRLDRECIDGIVDRDLTLAPTLLYSGRFLDFLQGMIDNGAMLGAASFLAMSKEEHQLRIDQARQDYENICRMLPEANQAGMRLVVGDDYGVITIPHGDYADELALYVKELGIPALDVIRWATKNGAETVDRGDDLGTIEVGKFADLLVIDGDPIADITCLKDRDKLQAIVKNGTFYKDAL